MVTDDIILLFDGVYHNLFGNQLIDCFHCCRQEGSAAVVLRPRLVKSERRRIRFRSHDPVETDLPNQDQKGHHALFANPFFFSFLEIEVDVLTIKPHAHPYVAVTLLEEIYTTAFVLAYLCPT